jgi:hypothetical protein
MNTTTRRVVMNYIQALISALVYMSNIRSLMLRMETDYSQSLATAKVNNIAEELKIAKLTYTAALQKVMTTYSANIAALDKKHLWGWLGPLIAVIVSVIMCVVMVSLAVATVLSGGATAPLLVGAIGATSTMVSAIIGAAATIVVTMLVIIDAGCQWAKGKSMWTMLCAAFGITNQLEVNAISAAFEILIQLIAVVVTCGAMVVMVAVKQAVTISIKALLSALSEFASVEMGRIIAKQAALITIMGLLSSGLLTEGLTKLGEVLLKGDDKKAALFAMIMTMVIMFTIIVLSAALGKGDKAVKSVKGAIEKGEKVTEETAQALKTAGAIGAGAGEKASKIAELMKSISNALKKAEDYIAKETKEFFSDLKKGLLYPFKRDETREAETLKKFVEDTRQGATEVGKKATKESVQKVETAFKELSEQTNEVEEVGRQFKAETELIEEAGTAGQIQKAGATVTHSLRNAIWKGVGRPLLNLCKNIRDHYKELMIGEKGDDWMEKFAKRLILLTELLKVVQLALQITAAAKQYEAAKETEYYDLLLAGLAEETAVLDATMKLFSDLSGIDQTETIRKISESGKESFQNWVRFLKLVSDFIKDAGERVSELTSKAAM